MTYLFVIKKREKFFYFAKENDVFIFFRRERNLFISLNKLFVSYCKKKWEKNKKARKGW